MGTAEELRQRVGENLALVPIGQDLEAQDVARIDAAYAEIYERLKKKGLAVWAFANDIPTHLFPYVSLMMEEKLLTSYSVPDARYQRIKNDAGPDGMMAQAKLAELAFPEYESTSEETDY